MGLGIRTLTSFVLRIPDHVKSLLWKCGFVVVENVEEIFVMTPRHQHVVQAAIGLVHAVEGAVMFRLIRTKQLGQNVLYSYSGGPEIESRLGNIMCSLENITIIKYPIHFPNICNGTRVVWVHLFNPVSHLKGNILFSPKTS